MDENDLSRIIIGCAMRVHTVLGPGLLESAYEECLDYELRKQGLNVSKQVPLHLMYENVKLDCVYRLDLMVENKVIIEVKTVESFKPIHAVQLLTYLKLANCKLGLLINFNVTLLKEGIKRVVHQL
ncbi:GxxExxY protein [Anabaenopsis tanganyikae CS-531]|jgi:GxxExxY protein|uniref:GxxExxY protein n=2 Tax=Anabaenopsis TaxID=110103 RepID=A0ABT6KAE1_9CYAN|nr:MULTISPECIES: GxxExxY protein [Anabaenopsis]MDB9539423.1 GxxExxY protein [Anabaenopsis arnoldii]MDH6091728.1 GxxExxY protein [Anabaenopsis arnoldii]MDH6097458.1 GxxExxY protein [Anabaenopsis sp. FSS-46]MDH6104662.1 GxxExxY protein [Anabaenopsis tanganyikae CS-531]